MSDTIFGLLGRLAARGELEEWWRAPVSALPYPRPDPPPSRGRESLAQGGARLSAHGLPIPAMPVFLAWMAERAKKPVLAIVADPETAFGEMQAWFRSEVKAHVFPAVETLPFD